MQFKADPMLPIAPFREFLEGRLRYYGSEKGMARALGVDRRAIYRWRHESTSIHISVVDEVLVADGSVSFAELYPEDLSVAA